MHHSTNASANSAKKSKNPTQIVRGGREGLSAITAGNYSGAARRGKLWIDNFSGLVPAAFTPRLQIKAIWFFFESRCGDPVACCF
jgi:hypothetical protein